MTPTQRIERTLSEVLGLRPRHGGEVHLGRELDKLRHELGIQPTEVAARLDKDRWLLRRLAGSLTVKETFFCRHPEHFDALAEHLRWLEGEAARPAVIWSAGCATGEEPYSMAIAIHRALGANALSRVRILGTDVCEAALLQARCGVYRPWSFRGTTQAWRAPYFEREEGREEQYRVVGWMRDRVVFRHLSLEEQLSEFSVGCLEATFFRNVAIYLTDMAVTRLYVGLGRALKRGGLLVLGPADPPPPRGSFERVNCQSAMVYRRTHEDLPTGPRSPSAGGPRGAARGSPPEWEPASAAYAPRESQGSVAERSLELTARQLADRGCTSEALEILRVQRQQTGESAGLLGLTGRIQLAAGNVEQSARDLQAAIACEPTRLLLRFYYALSLEAANRRGPCQRELSALLQTIETRDDAESVGEEGDAISVASLRRAIGEVLRRVE